MSVATSEIEHRALSLCRETWSLRRSNGVVVTPRVPEKHVLYVPAVTIDSVLSSEPRIDLIKIDIEAHEPYALRGMANLIKGHRPKIATEFHPWAIGRYNDLEPVEYIEQIIAT
jgi:FkbM family methyltransferase